jgi:hypothetical protein
MRALGGRVDDAQCLTARHIYDSWAQILAVAKENGRATDHFDNCFYHHIYIDEDKTRALHEARSFLDRYYSANYTEERLRSWLTCGSARECIADLRKFRGSGAHRITLRLSTEKKESEQFDKLVNDVTTLRQRRQHRIQPECMNGRKQSYEPMAEEKPYPHQCGAVELLMHDCCDCADVSGQAGPRAGGICSGRRHGHRSADGCAKAE